MMNEDNLKKTSHGLVVLDREKLSATSKQRQEKELEKKEATQKIAEQIESAMLEISSNENLNEENKQGFINEIKSLIDNFTGEYKYLIDGFTEPLMDYESLFYMALKLGNMDVVKWLVNNYANVNKYHLYLPPLAMAINNGHLDLAEFLIDNGARIDQAYGNNANPEVGTHTALKDAISNLNLEAVKYLMEKGASSNEKTLVYAVNQLKKVNTSEQGVVFEIINYLISKGLGFTAETSELLKDVLNAHNLVIGEATALVEESDDAKKEANDKLYEGVLRVSAETVKQAIKAGADVNKVDPSNGYTPLLLALRNEGDKAWSLAVVRALIDAGANLNAVTKEGKGALDIAKTERHIKVIKEAIDQIEDSKPTGDKAEEEASNNDANDSKAENTSAEDPKADEIVPEEDSSTQKALKNFEGVVEINLEEKPFILDEAKAYIDEEVLKKESQEEYKADELEMPKGDLSILNKDDAFEQSYYNYFVYDPKNLIAPIFAEIVNYFSITLEGASAESAYTTSSMSFSGVDCNGLDSSIGVNLHAAGNLLLGF